MRSVPIVASTGVGKLLDMEHEMKSVRSMLYLVARLMGDVNAVKKNKVGRRIGRRLAGKLTGRLFRKFFE